MTLTRFLVREVYGDSPRCKNHPNTDATRTCASCLLLICEVCSVSEGSTTRCPQCVRSQRRRRALGTRLAIVALLSIGAGLVFLRRVVLGGGSETAAPQPPAGTKSTLEQGLDREPCDRVKMRDLDKELLKNGEPRLVIERSDAFLARCGDEPRVRLEMYFAYGNLSEWDSAAAVMTKLLEGDPNDSRYWSWRGLAFEAKGDLHLAVADFKQAMGIKPSLKGIPFNLARAYERLQTPCEGIGPLEQFLHYNPTDETDTTKAQLARLYAMEACNEIAGSGHAVIRFPAGAKAITTEATIEGHAGKFMVDTGASYVALTRSFVKGMGLATDAWPEIQLSTAGGMKKSKLGMVKSVEVQGVKAGHVEATVIDEMPGLQGLLGVSFLSRFVVALDPSKGVLELVSRRSVNDASRKK